MSFKQVESTMNLPKIEEEVLNFWDSNKTFEKSIKNREDAKLYSFYDGPPFATGTPHYGHILQSITKDVVPRYWTMKGYKVPRKWGWDCHGLPIENIVEKELGYTHKKEILDLGVEKFNAICRSKVMEYASIWETVIRRMGRWADMKNAYKTMDLSYMESVWWVFKELWSRGLVYESYRSMHICPRCETTLSQSEVSEGYKLVKDLSAVAKFELLWELDENHDSIFEIQEKHPVYVLAWTTTPWTLIGNVALAVGKDIDYALIHVDDKDEYYILAKDRLAIIKENFKILETFRGEKIVGFHYRPLFNYYFNDSKLPNKENGWKIYDASFVTTEEGTGVVHIAPAFGEDDMNLGKENHLPFIQHVGMDGIIKSEAGQFAGMHVKDINDTQKTDVEIIKDLAHRGLLFSKEKYEHSYPHCWRCDTPLLNYATSSWFVSVAKVKEDAMRLAKQINWSPNHIKEGRFGKWLEGARDWSISRQRFWASVIPIWRCDDCGELMVLGSVAELRKLSNQKITKIIFVRHGESEKNILKIKTATRDKWPLTEKGRLGVEMIAQKINDDVDFIISSPVLRAKQTAEILNKKFNLGVVEDELVSEIEFGEWTDLPKEERKKLESHKEFQSIKSDLDRRYTFKNGITGESREDVVRRTEKFIEKVAKQYSGKTILVVGHGGLYPTISKILHNISHDEFFRRLDNIEHDEVYEFYLTEDGKAFDLHKDVVDKITIPCVKCKGEMKRVPDVLDTWFDSGSMPYAQLHYPFENADKFEETFPADFIGEAQDQTRAWFYYLHILATAIKQKIAYKNVVVSGIILAEDGKKMSKKLQNYPDPMLMFDKYGADVVRFYILNSPVLQAENLNFSEKDLAELSRGMFRMLWNSYSFFTLYANIDKWEPNQAEGGKGKGESVNLLDRWIVSLLDQLTLDVNKAMESYDLTKASRLFAPFIDNLSNWYIRRSRKRFWKSENDLDKNNAYQTLYHVLVRLSKLMAPFTPFLAEEIFKNLTGEESVHLREYPDGITKIDEKLNSEMLAARKIVELGLSARAEAKIKIRQPLATLTYRGVKLSPELESIIADEVNVKNVKYLSGGDQNTVEIDTTITEDLKIEGLAREVIRSIQSLRKESNFNVADRIDVYYATDSDLLDKAINLNFVAKEVLANNISNLQPVDAEDKFEGKSDYKIDNANITIAINR